MDSYFAETTIRVEIEGRDAPVTFIMRPLKVKEIPALLRLEPRGHGDDDDPVAFARSFPAFIDLVASTVDSDIRHLPREALNGIIQAFDALNFPDGARKGDRQGKEFDEREFARMVEFLVSQGHSFSDIEEYTLPRFRLFVDLAAERLSGKVKRKASPLTALQGLGIPVRQ